MPCRSARAPGDNDLTDLLPAARALAPDVPEWVWTLTLNGAPIFVGKPTARKLAAMARWVAVSIHPDGTPRSVT